MPRDDDDKIIIQIAAVLFDHTNGIEERVFNLFVKPSPVVAFPDFFIELTGISEEMVSREGVSFPEALARFIAFTEGVPIWTFQNDYHVFEQNCVRFDISNPFPCSFIRVKPQLASYGIDPCRYSSGTLHEALGIDVAGRAHVALHDVRSLSQSMHALEFLHLRQKTSPPHEATGK